MEAVMETHVHIPDNPRPQSESDEGEEEKMDEEFAEEEEDGGHESRGDGNAGWAAAMAKILRKKSIDNGSGALMKDRKLEKTKERERQEQLEKKKQVDRKRAWEMMSRQKPDVVKDRETERALQRVATRGVVQLFNAVRKHQQVVEEKLREAGGSNRKKTKLLSSVSKRDFIEVLRQSEDKDRGSRDQSASAEAVESWSVLRDDFMMGASMKDWDKHSDGEDGQGSISGGVAEESDSE